MVSKRISRVSGLVALFAATALFAQTGNFSKIKIYPTTNGVSDSGIDISTNATMPNIGAWHIHGEQNKENATIDSYGGAVFPGIYVTHSGGTEASPAAVPASQNLAIFAGGGWDGAAYQRARARITYVNGAGSAWTTGSTPTEIDFWTTDSGGTAPTVRWKILSSGDLLPNGSGAYRIGYLTSRVSEFYTVDANLTGGLGLVSGASTAKLFNAGSDTVELYPTGAVLRPTTSSFGGLGDATKFWASVYTGDVETQNINSVGTLAPLSIWGAVATKGVLTSSSIVPSATNTYLLGGSGTRYLVIYGTVIDAASGFVAGGSTGITGATCSSFKGGICVAP